MTDAASDSPDQELARLGYRPELRRRLGLGDLLVYGLVCMVPTAPFAIFGGVFDVSHGMVPLVYLVGFGAMLFTALSYQQMAQAFPVAGSVYAYVGRGLHESVGFLAGWAILLDYLLIPTLLYVIGANAMATVWPGIPQHAWIVFFVVLNTAVNLRGVETTARANLVFLGVQLVVLAVFAVLAALAIQRGAYGAHWSLRPLYDPAAFSLPMLFGALSMAVLCFLGFDAISTLTEESRGGARAVGRATVVSLALVAALFVLQTWLAALLLPELRHFPDEAASNNAFFEVGRRVAGPWMQIVIALTVAVGAALANALVSQAATSRLLFAMARDGQLPRFLRKVHAGSGVPRRAILLVAGLSLVLGLLFLGKIALLATVCNFGALTAFALLHVAVAWHFRRSGRWLMHGVVPLVGGLILLYVLYNADRLAQIGGLAWLAAGAVVVLVLRRRGRSLQLALDQASPPGP
ncbi:APC family permease [Pseudoxanthomonas winnipegensis]|uniref:APC family permease n=1 Tax=Pseudoxanthomonas winnipegensis TaxID=2480810 RepID=UPI00102DF13E|nr:APC family permease [Pseudoxanthomonas winnipegensis]TAA44094.1 APC family permease [Pseudoxanthomonas winnipegensis]